MTTRPVRCAFVVAGLAIGAVANAADGPDAAFVAKVSQGGMFEVAASKLATRKGSTQDVRDFAVAEVHDHTLVGAKLKTTAAAARITFPQPLNADFSARLDQLGKLSGAAFDQAYMAEMATIHDADGAAFATEAQESPNAGLKAFADETHTIVLRHIGAIHGASPPAK